MANLFASLKTHTTNFAYLLQSTPRLSVIMENPRFSWCQKSLIFVHGRRAKPRTRFAKQIWICIHNKFNPKASLKFIFSFKFEYKLVK